MPLKEFLIAVSAFTLAACSGGNEPVQTSNCNGEGIQVVDAWAKPAKQGQPVSAAYLTLCNGDASDHAIVSASFNGAGALEIHESSMQDGVMSMKKLDQLVLPAGEETKMAPGGYHLMLIGVNEDITTGKKPSMTFTFADGETRTIEFDVREPQEGEAAHASH